MPAARQFARVRVNRANSGCLRQARIRRPCSIILQGVFIQAGSEPGKDFEFLKLCVAEFEVSGQRAVSSTLRLAADTRNRFADIDRMQHAQLEQRR